MRFHGIMSHHRFSIGNSGACGEREPGYDTFPAFDAQALGVRMTIGISRGVRFWYSTKFLYLSAMIDQRCLLSSTSACLAVTGMTRGPICTFACGLLWRFNHHVGCLGAPPLDAMIMK